MVIMYQIVFYGFILFWMYEQFKISKVKFDKVALVVLSFPVLIRFVLELSAIGMTRQEYYLRTSNEYIDFITWGFLIVLLTIALWARFIQLRRV